MTTHQYCQWSLFFAMELLLQFILVPFHSLHDEMKCSQQRKAGEGGHGGESPRLFSVNKLVLGKCVAQQLTLHSVNILVPFDCLSHYRRFSRAMSWGHWVKPSETWFAPCIL